MRRPIPILVTAVSLAAPFPAHAATTCKNNTLTAVGRTVLTISYRSTGVTFADVNDPAPRSCGTIADPWTIHVRGGDPLWSDLVEVDVFDAAPRIDVNLAGPTDLLHVNAFDPAGAEIHIVGGVLSIANRATPLVVGTVTGANSMWVVGGSSGPDLIYGGDQGESLGGDTGADVINGGGGDDSIGGGNGPDILNGGDGEDVIFGGNGQDVITGDAGQDFLHGDWGRDTINAADGEADLVRGGKKHDTAVIDPGDDVKNVETIS